MVVVGPLKRKQGLPSSLSTDGGEKSALESSMVYMMLDLNAPTMEGG